MKKRHRRYTTSGAEMWDMEGMYSPRGRNPEEGREIMTAVTVVYPGPFTRIPGTEDMARRLSETKVEIVSGDPETMRFPEVWWSETLVWEGWTWRLTDACREVAIYRRGRRFH